MQVTGLQEREPSIEKVTAAAAVPQISILDKVDKSFARFIDCEDEQRWAAILYSAATGVINEGPTFPRFYIGSEHEESGKTLFMKLMVCLSANPVNASGTDFGVISALVEASLQAEMLTPTVFRDEVSTISVARGPLSDILREGYQTGATRSRSVKGQPQYYSIFVPFIMTGLRSGIPRDIRSRCIVVTMKPGHPKEYFDVRDSQRDMKDWGRELIRQARASAEQVNEFRIGNLGIPELQGRKGEVWEPLFAVAQALGGKKWMTRCLAAFRFLALAQSDRAELDPDQKVLRAAAEMAPNLSVFGFVPGDLLGNEMRRLPRYAGRSLYSMNKVISDAMPSCTVQRRLPSGERMRGYQLDDILQAWEAVRPHDQEELEELEEENPFGFDPDEECEDLAFPEEGTGGTGGTGSFTGSMQGTPPIPLAPLRQPSRVPLEAFLSPPWDGSPPAGQYSG